jgi:hypothetical protein
VVETRAERVFDFLMPAGSIYSEITIQEPPDPGIKKSSKWQNRSARKFWQAPKMHYFGMNRTEFIIFK